MKGKNYDPAHVYSEFYDIDVGSEFSAFKYPIKARTIKKFKVNTREFSPIRYMWKSSIPTNWFKLADPSRFYNIRVEKQKNKNTLQFLEETQKYIYNIRKPLANRKLAKTSKPGKRANVMNTGCETSLSRVQSERKGLATARVFDSAFVTNRQELLPRVLSSDNVKGQSYL